MQKPSRIPALSGGAFDARDLAERVRRRWEAIPEKERPGGKELAQRLGLESASAWTKRIYPNDKKKQWVPFRADELSILAPILYPGEPWRLFFDETISDIFRDELERHGVRAPERWRVPPGGPIRHSTPASPEKPAGPKRRGRTTG